jgi:hypothetical protein
MVGGWRLSVPNGHGRYMSMQRRHASVDILTKWVPRDKTFLFLFYQSQKNHTTSSLQSGAAAAARCCMARLRRNTAAITRQQPAEMSLDYDD